MYAKISGTCYRALLSRGLISVSTMAMVAGLLMSETTWAQSVVTPPPPIKASPTDTSADQGTTPQTGGLEDIIVTARKVQEPISRVPLAITAFSDTQISERGISSIADISSFTPSFRYQASTLASNGRADRSFSTLTFRGLALSNDYFTTAGGLLFVDGAPVIGASPPIVFDAERVEVLKGPQSAFFGRSTFSGAINYVSKDPPTHFEAKLNGSVATYGSYSASGSVGGPIVPDILSVRLSGAYDREAGQYRNEAAPYQRLGTQTTASGGLQFLLTPVPELRIKGAVSYTHDDDGPPTSVALKGTDFNCNVGGTEGTYYCGKLPSADQLAPGVISGNYNITPGVRNYVLNNLNNYPTLYNSDYIDHGGLRRDLIQASVRIDYQFDSGYALSAISAFHQDKVAVLTDLNYRDAQNTPNPFYGVIPAAPQFLQALAGVQSLSNDFSQEIRLTSPQDKPFRWLIGANYFTASSYFANIIAYTQFGPLFIVYPPRVHPTTPAVFGAAYWDINSHFTLSGELRYQDDQVAQDQDTVGTAFVTPQTLKASFKSFQPRATLTYHVDQDSLVYALFARGYRPGGFNDLSTIPPASLAALQAQGVSQAYGQESINNYELGVKSRLFDGRLQFSLDGYYEQYRNGQISQSLTFQNTPTTVTIGTFTRNVGVIDLYGAEAEVNWQATRALQLNSTFAYNGNTIKSGYCGNCLFIDGTDSLAGRRLPYTPLVTASIGAEYRRHLTRDYDLYIRGDDFYRGSIFVDQANRAYIGDRDTANLRLGVQNKEKSLEIYCTNCSDNQTAEAGTYNSTNFLLVGTGSVGQEIRYQLPARRVIGLRGGVKF